MEKQQERDSHSNINCGTWTKSVTLKVRRSLKRQWPSVVMRGIDIAIGQGFSAHQRVFGSSLRLPGTLLSDDPIDRQLLTADPYTNFHRANEMRTAARRALFKQNSARAVLAAGLARHRSPTERRHPCGRHDHGVAQQPVNWKKRTAVQAAGLARHRSQPREDIHAGDTTMVWRNNQLTARKGCGTSRRIGTSQIPTERRHPCGRHDHGVAQGNQLTGRKGWTGPGVVVAVSRC